VAGPAFCCGTRGEIVDAVEDARKQAVPITPINVRVGIAARVFIGAGSHHIYLYVKILVG
jgi:hypothetical protein